MYVKTLTVTDINNYIKKTIDNDFILSNAYIKGEISNFKIHSSGHAYFTIKDDSSKLNCVMFKTNAVKLTFLPEDGMEVVIKGRVSVYLKDGSYQLYCEEIKLEGMGELNLAYQKLKDKLEKAGLFKDSLKKSIPNYPKKIGIVTSPTGAAIRDIINVIKRRNKNIEILIYPALVQGINSSEDIIRGIKILNNNPDVDVIILARGGGSIEELWSFNDEKLAYAVYNSEKPIITGVGHETDFTIVDYVSDLRAPTPSAAAEIAVPLLSDLKNEINSSKNYLDAYISNFLMNKYTEVDMLKKNLELRNPKEYIKNQYAYIGLIRSMLNDNANKRITLEKEKLAKFSSLLNAHNPLNILNKGYSIIMDMDGEVLCNVSEIKKQEAIQIRVKDGEIPIQLMKQ